MALPGASISEPPPSPQSPVSPSGTQGFLRKFFRRPNGCNTQPNPAELPHDKDLNIESANPEKSDLTHRMSRKVVPELPRAQTFKRQQSERRDNLTPVEPTPDERRAVSVDRRSQGPRASSPEPVYFDPRTSAPGALGSAQDQYQNYFEALPVSPVEDYPFGRKLDQLVCKDDEVTLADEYPPPDAVSTVDTQSLTTSQYEAMIHEELEKKWILNLSMHFRDRSRREKFFVTYREDNNLWRRVTVSLDYRNAPSNSLEDDLIHTRYQRDKSAKIYEAIRESLPDIQFYDTVTNLKLQTTDGRLHVHVVEDGNEIIHYPLVTQVDHLGCRRIRERDIVFDSHMSGFVYKVNVNGQTMIKKEIPSPDTIEEFMYEVNALSHLVYSRNVIQFYGIVVDDQNEHIKGLLISFAERGALIDIIYEHCKEHDADIPWKKREKWARQIVEGLSDIHEFGFVQGDFTLSNIVIDENDDAKIIDINRRGCPVGWEPPEATPLIERNQRISMYIGVKSDLYQLGMVLWALAAQEDEPEAQGRPLILGPEVNVPDWYRRVAETCLSDDPRMRLQASSLLQLFPPPAGIHEPERFNPPPPSSTDDGYVLQKYLVDGYHPEECPQIRTVEQPSDWSYVSRPYTDASPGYEPYYYTRGRSPPSPITSNYGRYDSAQGMYDIAAWAANRDIPSSYSDVDVDELLPEETPIAEKPSLVEPNLTAAALGIVVTEEEDDLNDNPEQESISASKIPEELAAPQKQIKGEREVNAGSADMRPAEELARGAATDNQETTDDDSQDTPTMETTNLGTQDPTAETRTAGKNEPLGAEQETTRQERTFGELAAHTQDPETPSLSESNTKRDLPPATATAEVKTPTEQVEPANLERTDVPIMAGNTVPDPITPAKTDTTLKTVTPPSTCGPAEDGTTRTEGGSLSDKRIEEKGVDASKLRVQPVKQHDSLTGIGAAHFTNHDDILQKKELLDDDFNSAAPPVGCDSPMITTTDAKT